MSKRWTVLVSGLLLLLGLVGCGTGMNTSGAAPVVQPAEPKELRLYCGAGLRPPVVELIGEFERETGLHVLADYAGSEILLTRIKTAKRGELYFPGDTHYLDLAEREALLSARQTVAAWRPVLVVKAGNPKQITSVADFKREGVTVGLGHPEANAIGRASVAILKSYGLEDFQPTFQAMTVNELALHVKASKLDATLVWAPLAQAYQREVELIPIPQEHAPPSTLGIGILAHSQARGAAEQFLAFAASPRGQAIFQAHGFDPLPARPAK